MKQLIILLLLVPIISKAQFSKGDLFAGADIYTNYLHSDPFNNAYGINTSQIGAQFQLGIQTGPKLAFGVAGEFVRSRQSISEPGIKENAQHNKITAGLLARKSYALGKSFFLSLQLIPFYGRINANHPISGTRKIDLVGITFYPSLQYFPTQRLGLELGVYKISYEHNLQPEDQETLSLSEINYGSLIFGLTYYLRRNSS